MDPRLLENLQQQKSYTPPEPISDNMRDLDFQMQMILDRADLNSRDKARLYHYTLQRCMHRLDQYKNRPLGLVEIKPATPATAEPVYKQPSQMEMTLCLYRRWSNHPVKKASINSTSSERENQRVRCPN